MSKFYNRINKSNLTYEKAFKEGKFITNNTYGGFIFINKNNQITSLLVSGELVILKDLKDKEESIWNTVNITGEAYSILKENDML